MYPIVYYLLKKQKDKDEEKPKNVNTTHYVYTEEEEKKMKEYLKEKEDKRFNEFFSDIMWSFMWIPFILLIILTTFYFF